MVVEEILGLPTVSCSIQYNEAGINRDGFVAMLEVEGIGVTTQAITGFEEVDLMLGVAQGIQRANARHTAADNGDRLGHGASEEVRIHRTSNDIIDSEKQWARGEDRRDWRDGSRGEKRVASSDRQMQAELCRSRREQPEFGCVFG